MKEGRQVLVAIEAIILAVDDLARLGGRGVVGGLARGAVGAFVGVDDEIGAGEEVA